MREDLVEQLGRLELSARLRRDHVHDRVVDLAHPPARRQLAVLAVEVEVGDVAVDVVEHPARLVVLDEHARQRLQLALVVAELDDARLEPHPVAVEVGDDVELLDVEAELVEPLDALLDPPHLLGGELLLLGELDPERVVALGQHLDDLVRLHLGVEGVAGLEVEQLGEDVLAADGDVVVAHLVRQLRSQLAGLGVDEVRRERAGVAAEQHVGQRHVAPVEAGQVQAHQEHHDGVDQRREVLGGHAVREEAAVGQRELQVLGEQRGRQLLALRVDASGHDRLGHDARAGRAAGGRAASCTPGRRSAPGSPSRRTSPGRAGRSGRRAATARGGGARRTRRSTPREAPTRAATGSPGRAGSRRSGGPRAEASPLRGGPTAPSNPLW